MTQHPASADWGRWHGTYQQSADYTPMDASGLVHYGSSIPVSAPLQRAPHEQYPMGTTYSMAPVPSLPPQNTFGVHAYAPASPNGMVMPPYRSYTESHSPLSDRSQEISYKRDPQPVYREDPGHAPPTMKYEVQQLAPQRSLPLETKPSTIPDVASPAVTKPEPVKYENDSPVDIMMKAIQRGEDEDEDEADNNSETGMHTPSSSGGSRPPSPKPKSCKTVRGKKEKRVKCPWPGCKQRFAQTTHTTIHMRTHTGERPFVCRWEGCKAAFSQMGNYRTHFRRHTRERPYKCNLCDKAFAQRGNLGAHKAVHDPNKRFHCLIDGCGKPFSQRGNLKSHQNKFHKEAVEALAKKFAEASVEDLTDPQERTLFNHFKDIYRNMNKGIKGRGKGRTINGKRASKSPALQVDCSAYPAQQRTPPLEHTEPQHFSQMQHYPQHGLPQMQAWNYSMPRDSSYNMMIDRVPRGYEMYEMDQESMSRGSATGTLGTPATSVYDEDHSRGLAFRERLY
ncbi:hypothetical protein JX265_003958 [Neoarthrinium moseri]|uniref:C2H2-type domain-containing protein n=1 Tax=Neoarthrinium moseri TaxID=1658444 RepID=A0A9P9WRD0_9PEZI|nr:hypothetical protein JX266_001693 [Neoarthrinium moseri]KAI1876432.1 hypothetical protein JX265_003958 [Neoarthrinium moseri]